MREVAHAQIKRNPLSDLDELMQDGISPRYLIFVRTHSRDDLLRNSGPPGIKFQCSPLTFIVVVTFSHFRASSASL